MSDRGDSWVNSSLLLSLTNMLENIRDLLIIKYKYPRGTTLTTEIHLVWGQQVTRLDFTKRNRSRNIPVGDIFDSRDMPVSRLIINNMGAGNIHIDTNRDYGDLGANTPLLANETLDVESDFPSITSINLSPDNVDCTVRITAIV